MLENIRRIGIFMIAAQAVIHFSPGRQYEKYIKVISRVIILFLFMRPFLSMQGELEVEWQTGMEKIVQEYEGENLWNPQTAGIHDKTIEQMEDKVKSRLNEEVSGGAYCVKSVSLVFGRSVSGEYGESYEPQLQRVEVVMGQVREEIVEPVLVEEIVIGDEREKEETGEASKYQEIFANILGIEPDRVEVICVGGW